MRARRLLSLLELLETRGRTTAEELASALGVSVRTIYRDMDALAGSGVPVEAERGPEGGYALAPGRVPTPALAGVAGRAPGATAVGPLAGLTDLSGGAAELGLARVLAAGRAPVAAPATVPAPAPAGLVTTAPALPTPRRPVVPAPAAELDERARRIAGRFHLDVPGWFGATDQVPTLTGLVDAVWNQRVVHLSVRAVDPRDDAGPVEVHPLGLVLKTGTWYLVGSHPGEGEGPRVHPVGRIEDLRVLDARFDRPAGFDLWRAWTAGLVAPGSGAGRVEATLRLSPRGRALAPTVLRPHTARAVAETAGPPGADGWCRAVVALESLADARRELLALAGEVEVLAPAVLREQMSDAAGALAALYRSPEVH